MAVEMELQTRVFRFTRKVPHVYPSSIAVVAVLIDISAIQAMVPLRFYMRNAGLYLSGSNAIDISALLR
jgi:hypothetical protein